MQPVNIQQTHHDISVARLSSYKAMFRGASDHELYGIYCWNEALSAALFRLISITEVVMRNRFHAALSQHFHSHLSVGGNHSNDWYNHASLSSKSRKKVESETHYWNKRTQQSRPKKNPPSANDVVSKMSFGFWQNLLDITDIPWGDLLPDIIPGHRYKNSRHWSVLRHQDAFYARLELVRRIRNRIAHFEPIWKQRDLLEERRVRQGSPRLQTEYHAPVTPEQAIQRLRLIHDRTVELLKWFSPDRSNDYKVSYVANHFDWLCSPEGLEAYRLMQPGISLSQSRFKREMNSLLRRKVKVSVNCKNQLVGTYYPIPV